MDYTIQHQNWPVFHHVNPAANYYPAPQAPQPAVQATPSAPRQPPPATQSQGNSAQKPTKLGRAKKDYIEIDRILNTLDEFKTTLQSAINGAKLGPNEFERLSCAMTLSGHVRIPIDHTNNLQDPAVTQYLVKQSGTSDEPEKEIRQMCDIQDKKERRFWQRGAARGILNTIQDMDGFRYTVNNIWSSKDDGGHRFSYTCLDSFENKERHANTPKTQTEADKTGQPIYGPRKETWDCGGQITIKFSAKDLNAEIIYKHKAIHATVAERAPPPRPYVKKAERLEMEKKRSLNDPIVPYKGLGHSGSHVDYSLPNWMYEGPPKAARPRGRHAIREAQAKRAADALSPRRMPNRRLLPLVALLRIAGARVSRKLEDVDKDEVLLSPYVEEEPSAPDFRPAPKIVRVPVYLPVPSLPSEKSATTQRPMAESAANQPGPSRRTPPQRNHHIQHAPPPQQIPHQVLPQQPMFLTQQPRPPVSDLVYPLLPPTQPAPQARAAAPRTIPPRALPPTISQNPKVAIPPSPYRSEQPAAMRQKIAAASEPSIAPASGGRQETAPQTSVPRDPSPDPWFPPR